MGIREERRRDKWIAAINQALAGLPYLRPDPWQIELAARILARRTPRPGWPPRQGAADIWAAGHEEADSLVKDMRADGRLDAYGNWTQP